MKSLRIVFMGTPEFAVASLDALVKSRHQVVAVVTVADKPAGRGKQIQTSAVKDFALTHDLPILQPEKLRDEIFLEKLRNFHADLFVVVAFRMLPEVVWNMPPHGTINLHGSLLPQYRGAAPINRAIMEGEATTGVTTFFLKQEIDTGNIIDQRRIEIGQDENAGQLHDRMMIIGAELLLDTVDRISNGEAHAMPQDEVMKEFPILKHAPKIFKEDCKIQWENSLDHIHNHIRGLSPYPAAFTMLEGKTLKIYSGRKEFSSMNSESGTFITDGKSFLKFAAKDGWYYLSELQLEGKKRMNIDEFLRGWRTSTS